MVGSSEALHYERVFGLRTVGQFCSKNNLEGCVFIPNCSNGMFAGCVSLTVLIIIPVSSNWFLHHINMSSHGKCMIEPQSNLKMGTCKQALLIIISRACPLLMLLGG